MTVDDAGFVLFIASVRELVPVSFGFFIGVIVGFMDDMSDDKVLFDPSYENIK